MDSQHAWAPWSTYARVSARRPANARGDVRGAVEYEPGIAGRRALVVLAAVFVLTPAILLGTLTAGHPTKPPRRVPVPAAQTYRSLPTLLQNVASEAIGRSDRSLWVSDRFGIPTASGGDLTTRFTRDWIDIRADGGELELGLAGVGRGTRLGGVALATPRVDRNSVYYRHGPVAEWYRNGPYGLEQGFTLDRRPTGAGELILELGLRGSLFPRQSGSRVSFTNASGEVVLRYGELSAVDATGRTLPVAISLAGDRLELRIDDRAARYPVHLDPFIQVGSKLVAEDESTRGGSFGFSVALSGDGDTALIGGPEDAEGVGAAWVFTRTGSVWTQQAELQASGEEGSGGFGAAVALSAEATTALIGSPSEGLGSAWVFTRSGSTWSQQGPKLTGAEQVESYGQFGSSVSLSGAGGTALIGGSGDHNLIGAAWVFERTGSVWSQQGPKLVASGESGMAQFGLSVSLSEDGRTALIGGPGNIEGHVDGVGAAWVFTLSGSSWTQQARLTGEGESGGALLGWSVAISGDGDTALVGGPDDSADTGAAWVFKRSGSTWSQQGSKLIGSDTSAAQQFGWSVAIASNGETALIGGPYEGSDSFVGAAWVFTDTSGLWSQQGAKLTGSGELGGGYFGQSVALSDDGDTAMVGGSYDNHFQGAAWAFARTEAVWSPQGEKLTGGGEKGTGNSRFGTAAAIAASGTTALIGGPDDGEGKGAVWVFTRSGSNWTEQAKLTGTSSGLSAFGTSVALSANGDTALVGGPYYGDMIGAAWVFTRKGTSWTQQAMLRASGLNGFIDFGSSVALSGSGAVAVVGAPGHEAPTGSAWVFRRNAAHWGQQAELTATDEVGHSEFGEAAAISADGRTILVGGPADDHNAGAAWVFTGSGSGWSQQGSKLTPSGERGAAGFGDSVALSSDGDTALIGAPGDSSFEGAAWVFTRADSIWRQQGGKLTPARESGAALFGHDVALSGSGNTALIGGADDEERDGAVWAFARSKSRWSPLGAKLQATEETGAGEFGESVALSSSGLIGLVGGPGDDDNVGAAWPLERGGT